MEQEIGGAKYGWTGMLDQLQSLLAPAVPAGVALPGPAPPIR
jgi:hypothetical protein